MNIDYPAQEQMEALRALWQEAFGDTEEFLEHFYTQGFAPDRCRCVTLDGRVAAALYWFDCSLDGKPVAYLYGVATGKKYRKQGICRALAENTHAHLKYLGYAGEVMVQAEDGLFGMYEKMGFTPCGGIRELSCPAGDTPALLRKLDAGEFARLRREYLPAGGVLQEGDNLAFLETVADFYAGEDFLVTVSREEEFFAPELLGNVQAAPGILAALGKESGHFRAPGEEKPFTMWHDLSGESAPAYFGLAFD